MKRILKIFFLLLAIAITFYALWILITYSSIKKENEEQQSINKYNKIKDSLECICFKVKARENINRGNIIAYYNGNYFSDIAFRDYNIYTQYMTSDVRAIMDSVIFKRYGSDFYSKVLKKADSLYAKNPYLNIDLDGYYTAVATKEPEYKCGGTKTVYDYVESQLFKIKLLPLQQDTCYPSELVVDAVITKEGKLRNPRILLKLSPKIDSTVFSLLAKLPCDWEPAENGKNIYVDFRKKFYFFFR